MLRLFRDSIFNKAQRDKYNLVLRRAHIAIVDRKPIELRRAIEELGRAQVVTGSQAIMKAYLRIQELAVNAQLEW